MYIHYICKRYRNLSSNSQIQQISSLRHNLTEYDKSHNSAYLPALINIMPYRRLPNTDLARLRAMQTALKKYEELGDGAVPYSFKTVSAIGTFLPRFETAIQNYKQSLASQTQNNERYQYLTATARMYISHFIQVLNLACIRGEIKPDRKTFYRLLPNDNSVPDLSSDSLVFEWGKNIIDGEVERQRLGGAPIYNPAIGKVKVHYDQFKDAFQERKVYRKNTERHLEMVQNLRSDADKIILDLWNQIEGGFANLGTEKMQEKSKEFGVVYYLRRKERKAMQNAYHELALQFDEEDCEDYENEQSE